MPLTNVAEQPDNEEPLTPNHFLIQRPFNGLPPGQLGDQQPAILKTWKNTQKLMNHIWRRLVKEYLPTLSRRSKWSNSNDRPLRVDDIVWVLKGQTPRGIWPLGRFMETTTRWRYNSRKGKNGLRHVRSTRFRSRTCFFCSFFYFLCSGFRQRELPPSHKLMHWWYWQHFSLQFQSRFPRRWQKTSINWCLWKPLMPPLCPCSMLPMLLQLSRRFK